MPRNGGVTGLSRRTHAIRISHTEKRSNHYGLATSRDPHGGNAQLAAMAQGSVQVDLFTWNKRLARYAKTRQYERTMQLFQQMQREGMNPDMFTFVPVLTACSNLRALTEGRRIHEQIIRAGSESDVFACNCLVDMYSNCGSIDDALGVFSKMPIRNVFSWNAIILGCVKCGHGRKALELFIQMQREGVRPQPITYVRVLNACASVAALVEGRCIHEQIIRSGCESDVIIANSLVDMYAKCGSVEEARRVFDKMPTRNVVAWTAMIVGYVKCGEGRLALEMYWQMEQEGVDPDVFTFVPVLNACSHLRAVAEGRRIHKQIRDAGCESDVFASNSLIEMYSKCGSIEDASIVFNKMPIRNVFSWNAMILGYVTVGQGRKALELFLEMRRESVRPQPVTYVRVLNACASLAALEEGRNIHAQIMRSSCESNVFVANGLVDMYAKCGSVEDARRVFDKMPTRNVVAWTTMIVGYVKCGQGHLALELYRQMEQEGLDPDRVAYVGVLNACASVEALDEGRRVHEQIIRKGCESDAFVASSLVDMYTKCASLEDARKVFDKMGSRDVVAWTTMIVGYVKCGEGQKALELSRDMQQCGVKLDRVAFVGMLNACASVGALEDGRRLHERIIRSGHDSDAVVANSLVDMYAKCGSIDDARRVFDKMALRDVVAWNVMIQGYVKGGQGQKAFELSRQMQQEGIERDAVAFVAVLNACASVAALEEGRAVHKQIIQEGYESDIFVSSTLVDMYTKCGSVEDAWRVFNEMPRRDVVAWSAMIVGLVNSGEGQRALELTQQMQREGLKPDRVVFVGLVNACASVAALEEGRRVHKHIIQRGYESDVSVANSLVNMYAKCGSIEDAQRVFNKMPTRDVVAWNTMLAGYAMHGHSRSSFGHLEGMLQESIEVDGITFISLLSACGHGGFVDEGIQFFELMRTVYKISPTLGHYACIVDLLGRAGRLHEAEDVMKTMSYEPGVDMWKSLLGACRVHGNVEMRLHFARRMLEFDPEHTVLADSCESNKGHLGYITYSDENKHPQV